MARARGLSHSLHAAVDRRVAVVPEAEDGKEAVSGWLFRRVGVDIHVGDRYVPVGRIPVIVLVLAVPSVIAGAMWLVVKTIQVFQDS